MCVMSEKCAPALSLNEYEIIAIGINVAGIENKHAGSKRGPPAI